MILNKQEKKSILLSLVTAVIAIFVTFYLISIKPKEKLRINGKIHIIYTSGDIEPTFKQQYNKNIKNMPYYDINIYDPQMSAADIIPSDWNAIAQDIVYAYNNYNAIVIVCGKETLAYTASALAFMLENLTKPIILTDGNLYNALRLASTTGMCEVMVASGNNLLRGCRVVPKGYNTFISPTYPVLTKYNCLDPPKEKMKVMFINPKVKVIVMKIYPGIDHNYLQSLKSNKMQGIILETYGIGKSPINDKILQIIHEMAKKGVIIVSVTQNIGMKENFETDIRLLEAGVIDGRNMTTYAAFTKLHYLIGNVEDRNMIGQLLEMNFRGEIGPPPVKIKKIENKKIQKNEKVSHGYIVYK